jgi:hypothetical protein
VSRTALRRGNAALKDVRSKIKREEFVSHMAQQRWRVNDATSRGVPHMRKREESVTDIAQKVSTRLATQREKQTLFLLLFHYHIKQLIMKRRKNLILGFVDLVECQESLINQIMTCRLRCVAGSGQITQ